MKNLNLLVCLLLVLGCGGAREGNPESPTVNTTEVTPTETKGGHLVVTAMRIVEVDSTPQALVIRQDGRVVIDGKVFGTVHSDGSFTLPGGKVVATLNPDGTMTDDKQVLAGFHIAPNGVVSKEGSAGMSISGDGVVTLIKDGKSLRLEGDAQGRRAAMFVLLLVMM